MESTKSVRAVLLAIALLVILLAAWETFWRMDGYPASPDDNRHLWAENRGKLKHLGAKDHVLIGSSRVLFDIQLDEWEEVTGRRPIQLAIAGGTPTPVFDDIVNNTEFNGTILMGITPFLFFFGAEPGYDFYDHPAGWAEHFHKRTYAQRFNHWMGKPLQRTFAFLENDEDVFYNDLDLKTIINRIPLKGRVPSMPPFPWFQYLDEDRNITMLEKVTADTAYAGMIKRTWQFFISSGDPPDSAVVVAVRDEVIRMTIENLEKFRSRGGKVIFIRCPSSDWIRDVENMGFPRENFWDILLEHTGAPGYHFEDYPFMNKYVLPEWSHLATPDAKQFTTDLANQLIKDGVLGQ